MRQAFTITLSTRVKQNMWAGKHFEREHICQLISKHVCMTHDISPLATMLTKPNAFLQGAAAHGITAPLNFMRYFSTNHMSSDRKCVTSLPSNPIPTYQDIHVEGKLKRNIRQRIFIFPQTSNQ